MTRVSFAATRPLRATPRSRLTSARRSARPQLAATQSTSTSRCHVSPRHAPRQVADTVFIALPPPPPSSRPPLPPIVHLRLHLHLRLRLYLSLSLSLHLSLSRNRSRFRHAAPPLAAGSRMGGALPHANGLAAAAARHPWLRAMGCYLCLPAGLLARGAGADCSALQPCRNHTAHTAHAAHTAHTVAAHYAARVHTPDGAHAMHTPFHALATDACI